MAPPGCPPSGTEAEGASPLGILRVTTVTGVMCCILKVSTWEWCMLFPLTFHWPRQVTQPHLTSKGSPTEKLLKGGEVAILANSGNAKCTVIHSLFHFIYFSSAFLLVKIMLHFDSGMNCIGYEIWRVCGIPPKFHLTWQWSTDHISRLQLLNGFKSTVHWWKVTMRSSVTLIAEIKIHYLDILPLTY